jgi:1-acyl-sn-glycerol-3-phosphate acyltransferase
MGSSQAALRRGAGICEYLCSDQQASESEALIKAPEIGSNIPTRGNAFSHWLGRVSYKLTGWDIVGQFPDLPKFVLIVAPHTSNWDFIVGVGALFALHLNVSYLAKDSLFVPPLSVVLKWLGGIPVNRKVSKDRVSEMVQAFRSREKLILVFTPEGTRKRVTEWHTGFYHVAVGANVPILPVAFDYGKKRVIIGDPFYPTGNAAGDIVKLRAFFKEVTPKHAKNFAP